MQVILSLEPRHVLSWRGEALLVYQEVERTFNVSGDSGGLPVIIELFQSNLHVLLTKKLQPRMIQWFPQGPISV